jgi:hypothetical protein
MGITVSLLTKQFKPIDAIIGFKQIIGERSGSNFGDTFFETIKSFELQEQVRIVYLYFDLFYSESF